MSLILVCVTAAYLARMYEAPGQRVSAVPKAFAVVTHITALVLAITVIFGVLTTGAGPHSGDENVIRDGFDATLLSHVHAWPGYVLAALLLIIVVWAARAHLRPIVWLLVLTLVTGLQILIGVYQARNGLPPLAVGMHMVLAALNAAAMTIVVMRLKRPVGDTA